mgnify:CR=1 FL=1
MEYSFKDIQRMQALPLDEKIQISLDAIERALSKVQSRAAIAFSGGKDSEVLWHLIKVNFPEAGKNIAVIFGNTGVEFPESLKFARKLGEEWGGENFYETHLSVLEKDELKYQAQTEVLQWLTENNRLPEVLKADGKLKSDDILMRICPEDMLADFRQRNLIWRAGTKKNYLWCMDQYGYPILGKSFSKLQARRINIDCFLCYSHSKSGKEDLLKYYDLLRRVKISQACCHILKKEPSERLQAELKIDVIFKGLMASESHSRKVNFASRGFIFQSSRPYLATPFYHCNPLSHWTDDDIWQYIRTRSLPYSPLYDMTYTKSDGTVSTIKRNGCIGCYTDFGRKDSHMYVLRQTHPALWEWVMRNGMASEIQKLRTSDSKYRKQTVLDTAELADGAKEYDQLIQWAIQNRPCSFD